MVTDSGVYVLKISQTMFGFEPVSRRTWSDRFTSVQPAVSGIVFSTPVGCSHLGHITPTALLVCDIPCMSDAELFASKT